MVTEIAHQLVREQLDDLRAKYKKMEKKLRVTQDQNSNLLTESTLLKEQVESLKQDLEFALQKVRDLDTSSRMNEAITPPSFWKNLEKEKDPVILDKLREITVLMTRNNDEQRGFYTGFYAHLEKTLISPTQLAIEDYLGLKNDNVLKIEDLVEFKHKYLVAENVTPLIPFFKTLYDKYNDEAKERSRSGDVVNGWRYLNRKGFSCAGQMEGLIFVNKQGKDVVIPRVQRPSTDKYDFTSLVEFLIQILLMEQSS